MDLDDFRMILSNSGADVWDVIDAAVTVASLDHGDELKERRDRIVERLYANSASRCRNCDVDVDHRKLNGLQNDNNNKCLLEKDNSHERFMRQSPPTPQSIQKTDDDDDEDPDPYGGDYSVEDEKAKILRIKERLEDPDQSEDSLLELLQTLAEMEITFKALQETDIGRHVNRLRKHSSNEVRLLVKQLVRQWKDLVDEWVKSNTPNKHASSSIIDDDSPQQNAPLRNSQNGRHQVPDFAYSPNPHNGRSGSDKSNSEPEPKAKAIPPRRDAPAKQPQSVQGSHSAHPNRPQKESNIDMDRLASARKRLQENYQEANNARKQRTIQVMDIHEIPKPKNTFFSKNKGGSQGRR